MEGSGLTEALILFAMIGLFQLYRAGRAWRYRVNKRRLRMRRRLGLPQ